MKADGRRLLFIECVIRRIEEKRRKEKKRKKEKEKKRKKDDKEEKKRRVICSMRTSFLHNALSSPGQFVLGA